MFGAFLYFYRDLFSIQTINPDLESQQ
jgi:hypothetical protein